MSSEGFLALARNNGGAEIWRRADADPPAQTESPLRKPSPLALSQDQETWLQRTLSGGLVPSRGRYVPHGFLSSFSGPCFRTYAFRLPTLAVVGYEEPHSVELYDVCRGTLIQKLNFDSLIASCLEPGRPQTQADWMLLDIDLHDDLLCATFELEHSNSPVSYLVSFGLMSTPIVTPCRLLDRP